MLGRLTLGQVVHLPPGSADGVLVGDRLFVFPLCGFSLSLFCNFLLALQMILTIHGYT